MKRPTRRTTLVSAFVVVVVMVGYFSFVLPWFQQWLEPNEKELLKMVFVSVVNARPPEGDVLLYVAVEKMDWQELVAALPNKRPDYLFRSSSAFPKDQESRSSVTSRWIDRETGRPYQFIHLETLHTTLTEAVIVVTCSTGPLGVSGTFFTLKRGVFGWKVEKVESHGIA